MSVKTSPRRTALRQVDAITRMDLACQIPYEDFVRWSAAVVPADRRAQHERLRALLGH